jgi:hypothetical protein
VTRRRWFVLGAAAGLVLVVAAGVLYGPRALAQVRGYHTVTLRASGDPAIAQVGWSDEDHAHRDDDAVLPWAVTIRVPLDRHEVLSMGVAGDGEVSCEVTVDGRVPDSRAKASDDGEVACGVQV